MKRLALVILAFNLFGCRAANQIQEAKNFARCEFRLRSVDDLRLAGVSIQHVKSVSDLSLKKSVQLMPALAGKSLLLEFTLMIEAKNPNKEIAAMNTMEWMLYIDDHEMVKGVLDREVRIPADSVSRVPLEISTDLKKSLSGESRESLLKLAFNLAGEGNTPTHILLKVKPSIMVAGIAIGYPGYIDVQTEFTSKEGKKIIEREIKRSENWDQKK